jgi:uncharacterized protein YjeT (DUF2065 family)
VRVAIVLIVLGALVIASRGPLVIAPAWTVKVYRSLLTARPTVFGVVYLLVGLAMVGSVWGASGLAVPIVTLVGWVAVVFSFLPLLAPTAWCSFATWALSIVEDSGVARTIGVFAVALGAGVVYYGLSLL